MMNEGLIRRILVALDASTHSQAALEAAAEMADRLEAELLGLFVEDTNLLRLARLPFAREVGYPSAHRRELDVAAMDRALRAQAGQARGALETAAERLHLHWSFEVARGEVVAEVLTAAAEVDVIALGIMGRELTGTRLGSTVRGIVASKTCSVLVLQQGVNLGQAVIVLYDGSATAERALDIGIRLAQAGSGEMVVLLAEDGTDLESLEQSAAKQLQGVNMAVRYRRTKVTLPGLQGIIHEEQGGMLIVGADSPLFREDMVRELCRRLECPVLLSR